MNLPGTWLLALSRRHLDEKVVESIVVPTIADLQHEALDAGDHVLARGLALVRGYAAILRLLFWHGLVWRSPMRRLVSVLVLGGAGAALVIFLDSIMETRVGLGALFLVGMLASVAWRVLNLGGSYRRIFVSCLSAGVIVATALCVWLALPHNRLPHSWLAYVEFFASLVGSVGLASALIAAVASRSAEGNAPAYQYRLRLVAVAAAAFAACFIVRTLIGGPQARPFWLAVVMPTYAAFVAFFFALFAFAVYLPVMIGARRVLPRLGARLPLAAIGAALFPIPLLGIPLLQPPPSPWHFALPPPGMLLWMSFPYVIAGAVLGWLLAERPHQSASPVS